MSSTPQDHKPEGERFDPIGIERRLHHIEKELQRMSQALEALTQKVGELETEDEAVATAVQESVAEVVALEGEIATLQSTSGASDAEIEPLTKRVEAVTEKLDNAVTALKGETPAAS